jgi:moderate conductance mechanosensitive channel
MIFRFCLAWIVIFCWLASPSLAQKQEGHEIPSAKEKSSAPLTDAERILRLQGVLARNKKELAAIHEQLKDPKSDFAKAESAFRTLDDRRNKLNKQLEKLRQAGQKDEAAGLAKQNLTLERDWKLARERFELAIQERKTLEKKAANLAAESKQAQEALDQLQGTAPAAAQHKEDAAGVPDKKGQTAKDKVGSKDPDTTKSASNGELARAQEESHVKELAAQQAMERARELGRRKEVIQKSIDLEKQYLETLQKSADNIGALQTTLQKELKEKLQAKASQEAVRALNERIDAAHGQAKTIRKKVKASTSRLSDLQTRLASIQAAEVQALGLADQKRREAAEAKSEVEKLENPFSTRNLVRWLLNHGPKLVAVIIGVFLIYRLVRASSQRIVKLMTRQHMRGSLRDRQNRAETLVSVFRNSASIAVLAGGFLMALEELGIPIVPLMGGAAVIGLAVAFGAQNLIRDYFSGFMVLLEDQYGINDVVKIGNVAGLVERITLRMTVLRDQEGTLHFIPHGSLTTVSNYTHSWSRALFEIHIAYKEDVDRVMQVLMELARELRKDPFYGRKMLDDPEMLGVDSLGESGVCIQFIIKTIPLEQWNVKRELLRRIKRKFDELGIEIPFRSLYIKEEPGSNGYRQVQSENTPAGPTRSPTG